MLFCASADVSPLDSGPRSRVYSVVHGDPSNTDWSACEANVANGRRYPLLRTTPVAPQGDPHPRRISLVLAGRNKNDSTLFNKCTGLASPCEKSENSLIFELTKLTPVNRFENCSKRKLADVRSKLNALEEVESELMNDLKQCNRELKHRERHAASACPLLEEVHAK